MPDVDTMPATLQHLHMSELVQHDDAIDTNQTTSMILEWYLMEFTSSYRNLLFMNNHGSRQSVAVET